MSRPISQNELMQMLHQGLVEMGQPLGQEKEMQLIRYIELIAKWNKLFRLTTIRDLNTMVTRHLLDSLSVLPHIHGQTILDVGTGAGLPGIPLAIAMPDRQFTLLDSNRDKTRFLQQTCYQMRLRNVQVVHKRIEEYSADVLFDSVIWRAYGTLRDYIIQSQRLVIPDGQVLAMKGVYPLTELQDIAAPFKLMKVYPLKVPQLNAERHAIDLRYQAEVAEMQEQKETVGA